MKERVKRLTNQIAILQKLHSREELSAVLGSGHAKVIKVSLIDVAEVLKNHEPVLGEHRDQVLHERRKQSEILQQH